MAAARHRALRPLLVLLLVVAPLVELYVLIQVGQVVGALWTVLALVAVSVLGAWLLRREGWRTWRAVQAALTTGRLPGREVADGALVVLAGALLLTPGFVSDATGLLLLLPPVRAVARRALLSYAGSRVAPGLGGLGGMGGLGGVGSAWLRGGGGAAGGTGGSGRGAPPRGPGASGAAGGAGWSGGRSRGSRVVDGEVVDGEVVPGEVVEGGVAEGRTDRGPDGSDPGERGGRAR